MSSLTYILQSFNVYYRHAPKKLILLFLTTLVLGFSQGISIVLIVPLLELINNDTEVASSNFVIDLVKSFFNQSGFEINLAFILILYAVLFITIAFLDYYKSISQAKYQQEFIFEIRNRIFKKILTKDWNEINKTGKHNHIQVLTTEIPKMTTYYFNLLAFVTKLIMIFSYIVIALSISVSFTLIAVTIGVFLIFVLRIYVKNSKRIGEFNIQAFRRMLKYIDDFWLTIKMAKVHNAELFYSEKFGAANKKILDQQLKQVKNKATPQLLFTIAGTIILVTLIYLANNTFQFELPVIIVLVVLFARVFPHFKGLNGDLNTLAANIPSVQLVLNLDRSLTVNNARLETSSHKLRIGSGIQLKNVFFAYSEKKEILSNFNLEITPNTITGIFGESGKGKTTLVDIIAGLQQPDSGEVIMNGTNLGQNNINQWQNNIGYLPQDPTFIDGSLRENLIWDSKENITDSLIKEVLERVNALKIVNDQERGLDTYIANYQYHFSGGERQRLALTRVLLRNPDLLILDEATSGLDKINEVLIFKSLLQLKHKQTILCITHNPELKDYFDVIIEL